MWFLNYLFSVLEPPIFTKKPPSHVVLERGSTINLCCEATGSPHPRIEWSRAKQSQSYLPPAFQENGCLEVNTAKEYSGGDYVCRSTNRFGLAESLTTVIVPLTGFVYCLSSWLLWSHLPFVDSRFILVSQKELQNNTVPFKGWLFSDILADCDFIVSTLKLFKKRQNKAYTSKK